MRWAYLVLAYVRVLVWPVTIVTLLLIFRAQVRTVLSRFAERIKDIKRVRTIGGTEIDYFEAKLIDIQEEVANLPSSSGQLPMTGEPLPVVIQSPTEEAAPKSDSISGSWRPRAFIEPPDLESFLGSTPRESVDKSWGRIDDTVQRLYKELHADTGDGIRIVNTIAQVPWVCAVLNARGVMKEDVARSVPRVINDLDRLRYDFAFQPFLKTDRQLTQLEAYNYAASAHRICQTLLDSFNALSEHPLR
jgi:hypothetical protein